MIFYTYILYSKKFDRYYYGQTEDLESRCIKHNNGQIISTKRFIPWVLFAYKTFPSRTLAVKTERKLKNLKSRKKVAEFINKNDFVKLFDR